MTNVFLLLDSLIVFQRLLSRHTSQRNKICYQILNFSPQRMILVQFWEFLTGHRSQRVGSMTSLTTGRLDVCVDLG